MTMLQREHAGLRPRIEALRTAADAIDEAPAPQVVHDVNAAYDLLVHHVLPHADAEDRVLYRAVDEAMGSAGATDTMRRDHVEIERLTHELGEVRAAILEDGAAPEEARRALRRVLYAVHAVLELHLAKEEEIYEPLLEARLGVAGAARLLEEVHHATLDAKAAVTAFDHDAL